MVSVGHKSLHCYAVLLNFCYLFVIRFLDYLLYFLDYEHACCMYMFCFILFFFLNHIELSKLEVEDLQM